MLVCDIHRKSASAAIVASSAKTSEPSSKPHIPFAISKCFIWNFQVFQLLTSSLSILLHVYPKSCSKRSQTFFNSSTSQRQLDQTMSCLTHNLLILQRCTTLFRSLRRLYSYTEKKRKWTLFLQKRINYLNVNLRTNDNYLNKTTVQIKTGKI